MANYVTDTFTDTDATALDAHTPDVGGTWDVRGTDLTIDSNRLIGASFGANTATNDAATASDDYEVSATLTFNVDTGTERGGIRIRDTGVNNGYAGMYDAGSDEWQIVKDTFTVAASSSDVTFVATESRNIRLTAVADVITLYVNGFLTLQITDSTNTTGLGGVEIHGDLADGFSLDAFSIDDVGGGSTPGVHVVTGRGNEPLDTATTWLSTAVDDRPGNLSSGAAEPPNWYHVGMLTWGTVAHGAMVSYPVTRDLDLVQIPAGMDTLWFEFVAGVTATITELTAP